MYNYAISNCNTINNNTPGIPKNPATKAVMGFMGITMPAIFPKALKNQSKMPPITPFKINLTKYLIGKKKVLTTI